MSDIRRRVSSAKYSRIPQVAITGILNLEDILCTVRSSDRKLKVRRVIDEEQCNTSRGIHIPKNINVEINENLPECVIDLYEYKGRYNKLMDNLRALNKKCLKLKTKKLDTSQLPKGVSFEKICKLSTSAKLFRILQRPLRVPTVVEMINDAVDLNIKSLDTFDDVSVNVDVNTNKWSEINLYKYFSNNVKLNTYQLIVGNECYVLNNTDKRIQSHLLMGGSLCYNERNAIHKKATKQYIDVNRDVNIKLVNDDDIILTFTFYHNIKGHKLKEFDVLASQTLSQLTDKFECPSIIADEKLDIKGSCYMLNGVLYPDLRGGAVDYSVNLLEFYENCGMKVLKSSTPIPQDMAVLSNMAIPVYAKGYFLHYGDCEHRLMVTSMRLFNRVRDCPYSECYPICIFTPKIHREICQICNFKEAMKVLFNSLLLPENPAYLCEECYSFIRKLDTNKDIYRNEQFTQPIAINYNQ